MSSVCTNLHGPNVNNYGNSFQIILIGPLIDVMLLARLQVSKREAAKCAKLSRLRYLPIPPQLLQHLRG